MGSVRGFRCDRCHAEILATRGAGVFVGGTEWSAPVLCCGQPLKALEPDQVSSGILTARRAARCPRCGYKVHLVVHPAGPLVCMQCQVELVIVGRHPDTHHQATAPVAAAPDVGG
jgi:DNA-directed RNA polymerase subunit RPC12/RpoP